MAPRRTHKKSRAGCIKCKRRRIKCDEVHPRCGNCVKHAIVCDFSLPATERDGDDRVGAGSSLSPAPQKHLTPPPNPPPTTSDRQHVLPRPPSIPHAPPLSPPPAMPFRHPTPPLFGFTPASTSGAPVPLATTDLALMHHFTISTSLTISNRPTIQRLWSHYIPLLGHAHPFVTHALLAVSALHLNHLSPSPHLLPLAAAHHDSAVRGMALTLTDINRDNCDALVVSSCLVVIYSFVSSRLVGSDDLATWIPLLRGVHSILKQAWVWVTSGPLATLIKQYVMSSPPALDADMDARINGLYALCTDRSLPGAQELDDTDVSMAYFAAIAELRKSYASMQEWENIIGSIFTWPITVSDRFVELLVERRPRALVVFAYYCALFTGMGFWWARGSAEYEMERVRARLGEEWTSWIEWPIRRIKEVREREEADGPESEMAKLAALGTGTCAEELMKLAAMGPCGAGVEGMAAVVRAMQGERMEGMQSGESTAGMEGRGTDGEG